LRIEQEGLVESLSAGVELADLRYRVRRQLSEYLDSNANCSTRRYCLCKSARELANIITLYRSLGGGWQ